MAGRNLFATTTAPAANKPKGRNLLAAPPDMSELSKLSRSMTGELPGGNLDRARYEALPAWKKPLIAAGDVAELGFEGATMGWGNKAVAAARAPFTDKTYEQELADARAQTERARNRAGGAGIAAEVTGALATPSTIAKAPGAISRIGRGIAEGIGYGAVSAAGHDQDITTGAGVGALGGLGGGLFGELVSAGGNKVARLWREWNANPSERVQSALFKAAKDAGVDQASVQAAMQKHGPELMTADVLKKRGTSMGRAASNISPEARETLETAVEARKAGQNPRVVSTLESATGLPVGTRMTVEDLKKQRYAAREPAINQAYEAARETGFDLPREPFRDLIVDAPMGAEAYKKAGASLKNRAVAQGQKSASELARLDQMKRELDQKASVAAGERASETANQARGLSKTLRNRIDETIVGPEYAQARDLRRAAFAEEEAADLGADLAGGRIASDAPTRARAVAEENRDALAKAYALQQSENLLNKGGTAADVNMLNRPLQREAYEAALGPEGAAQLAQRLESEKLFNATNKDIVGNSTTMRQLLEAGAGSAGGGILGAALGAAGGYDPVHSAGLGALPAAMWRAGRSGLPVAQRLLATKTQQAMAPEMARALVASPSTLPMTDPLQAAQASPEMREWLARMMAMGAITQGQ